MVFGILREKCPIELLKNVLLNYILCNLYLLIMYYKMFKKCPI